MRPCAASLKVSMSCSTKGFLAAYTRIAAKHINIAMTICAPVPGFKKIKPPVRISLRNVSKTSKL